MTEDTIHDCAAQMMDQYKVSGMAIAWAYGANSPQYVVLGTDRDGFALEPTSLFPVASISKLATALCVLKLAEENRIALNDPLAKYLPQSTVATDHVAIRTLLSHLSGLPNWYDETRAPWSEHLTWQMVKHACLETQPIMPPNAKVIYSNVGYTLLATIAEIVTGQPFPMVMRERVFGPLGVNACYGDAAPRRVARILVAREKPENYGTPAEVTNSALWSEVTMPFGGLITNLDGALRLIKAFQGQPEGYLQKETIAEATRNQTGTLPGSLFNWPRSEWGLGPELRGTKVPHWTPGMASPESFGHLGASGCLVWADPSFNITYAIFATRSVDEWAFDALPKIGVTILEASPRA